MQCAASIEMYAPCLTSTAKDHQMSQRQHCTATGRSARRNVAHDARKSPPLHSLRCHSESTMSSMLSCSCRDSGVTVVGVADMQQAMRCKRHRPAGNAHMTSSLLYINRTRTQHQIMLNLSHTSALNNAMRSIKRNVRTVPYLDI